METPTVARRSFLKLLGIGAAGLALPKPLSIIAAKAADLEKPPLHVGYCCLDVPKRSGLGFFLFEFGMSLPRDISRERYIDFFQKWEIRLVHPTKNGCQDWFRSPVRHIPVEPLPTLDIGWCATLTWAMASKQLLSMPKPLHMAPGERWEFWLLAGEQPAFVMPEVRLALSGTFDDPLRSALDRRVYMLTFKKVNVDRAQAIKMGLCDAAEPEETFDEPDPERHYIINRERA